MTNAVVSTSAASSETGTASTQVDRADLLIITSELPWPLNTGGHLRTYHLLNALAKQFRVRLVTAVEDTTCDVSEIERLGVDVHAAVVGKRSKLREIGRVAKAAVSGEPYVLFHRHNRRAVRETLRRQLAEARPGAVYLDHLDPFAFRSELPDVPVVADLHNVYSTLTDRVADERRGLLRTYLRREARLLAEQERQLAQSADLLMTVSSQEQQTFHGLGGRRVELVPNGVDCAAFRTMPVGRLHERPVILFLGALSWQPNAATAQFLAQDVLPVVRNWIPDAVLQLVGRSPGPEVKALEATDGVRLAADVPDIKKYLEQATLLAVPLDSGGGTRLKILEAFAAGLPVVSSPVGCEGIDAEHDRHLLIADRDRFAAALIDALADPARMNALAAEGRQLAQTRYDWTAIGNRAAQAIQSLIDEGSEREGTDD